MPASGCPWTISTQSNTVTVTLPKKANQMPSEWTSPKDEVKKYSTVTILSCIHMLRNWNSDMVMCISEVCWPIAKDETSYQSEKSMIFFF